MQSQQPGNGYGQGGGYGVAPMHGNYGGAPQGSYGTIMPEGVRSIAKPTVGLLAARAALPIVFFLMAQVHIRLGEPLVYDAIRGLLGLVAVIFYFVWFARVNAWLKTKSGPSGVSTGMAIGGWFIPFANMILPCVSLADLWKRATNGKSAGLVVLWWLAYLGTIGFAMFFALAQSRALYQVGADTHTMRTVFVAMSYGNMVTTIVANGVWALIVREISSK